MSKYIYDYLIERIGNSIGVCALMGNLYVESKLDPLLLEGRYRDILGMSGAEYAKAFDGVSENNLDMFIRDNAGFGLAQWTYWSRKKALWEFAKQQNKSVGDLDCQLDYLWKELQGYKAVIKALKEATNLREASDIVALKYEKPKNTSEKYLQNRANYGQKFYDEFVIKMEGVSEMYSATYVDGKIAEMKQDGIAIPDAAWEAAKLCVGWPYTFGARGGKTIKDGVTVRTFDCRGFTYWILLQFGIKVMGVGCTSQWNDENNWEAKGEIKDIPEDKLVCLFYREKDDPKKMAHTGFGYRGETLECSSGVQYFAKRKAKWTYWAIPKGLYSNTSADGNKNDISDAAGFPTLRQGSKGDIVKTMQSLLVQTGSSIVVDGIFGSGTRSAVMAFQRKNGLVVDGICGPKTWAALVNNCVVSTDKSLYTVTLEHVPASEAEELLKKYSGKATLE